MAPAVVLFACVHNAGRSVMSCELFNLEADHSKAIGISAGTEPQGKRCVFNKKNNVLFL